MRTTITIPNELVSDLLHLTHSRKTTEAVIIAIEEWVRLKKIDEIKSLRGKLSIDNTVTELRLKEVSKMRDLNEE